MAGFRSMKKPDISKIHSLSGHNYQYRYHFSYKFAKKGKTAETILPGDNIKIQVV